ncbi:hypothetical protein DB32_002171 [Sandaracinus amylolyticus]|uniref:Uncharacterized protein n=1 Tax=Sandaracinus amylolyticus TaxID=927083 RepID=A0A0F6YGS2_9BACT|nr:hypothetical protein DB32_002171 [Sandaracinus amylolyticus]
MSVHQPVGSSVSRHARRLPPRFPRAPDDAARRGPRPSTRARVLVSAPFRTRRSGPIARGARGPNE